MQDEKPIAQNDKVWFTKEGRVYEGDVQFVTECGLYARIKVWTGKRTWFHPAKVADLKRVTI